MSELHPENLPAIETRQLDQHMQAHMLEDGSVVLFNSIDGTETLLTAERAYTLLSLLSKYRMKLYDIIHPKFMTLNWLRFEGSLLACLQKAVEIFQQANEPGYSWRVLALEPLSSSERYFTLQDLLTEIAEEPESVVYPKATLFYDGAWQGHIFEGKHIFAALYFQIVTGDTPVALFFRVPDDQTGEH